MKKLIFFLALLVSFTSMSQITTTTLENNTNEVLMKKEYPGDSAIWVISNEKVHWEYYDENKTLLLNDWYNIVETISDATTNSLYYIVKDTDDSIFKIQVWNFNDGSWCITHGFAKSYVSYLGNVNYIVNI